MCELLSEATTKHKQGLRLRHDNQCIDLYGTHLLASLPENTAILTPLGMALLFKWKELLCGRWSGVKVCGYNGVFLAAHFLSPMVW